MAKNVVKSVYCACHVDNSASEGNHISLTGVAFSGKSFSFDVWLYILGDAQVVLSQESGFSFGLENGVLCISHPSTGKKTVRSNVLPINKREWVNLFGVYDGQKMSFAVNGIPVGQVSCPDISFWRDGEVDVGRGFYGYCRSVRLYDIAVQEGQYHAYLSRTTYNAQEMPGLVAFMDMMQRSIPDLSGHGVIATRNGAVGVVDLAHVYCPSAGRYASLARGDAVNPGGFESGKFALYLKTYLRPSNQTTHALVSNGEFGDTDCVIVYTQKTGSTSVSVHLRLGEQEIVLADCVEVYQWVDIIVCHAEGKVTAFVNGTAFECEAELTPRTGKGALKIGNAFGGGDCTCGHYIAMTAVFDKPLAQADADDFLENHPFVFEDGLVALFSFMTGSPQELVSCGDVQLDSDDLIMAQRTFEELPQSPYKYRINQTQTQPSEMRLWEATTIWDGVKSYYKETYGLEPVQDEAQEAATVNAIATDSELLAAFAGLFIVAAITSAVMAEAIAAVKSAKMAKLASMGALRGKGAVGGATGAAAAAGSSAAGAGALQISNAFVTLTASVALVLTIAAAVGEVAKEHRKDKPDVEDDDEKPSIKLLAISFQHTPDNPAVSAVRCRDHEGSCLPPEWTTDKRTGAEAVYIADQLQTVKIKVKFKILDASKQPASSYSISLWSFATSNPALFDDFSLTESGLLRDVEYERELTAKSLALPSTGLWKYCMELWWNYTVNGHTATLPNTKFTAYTLPTTPVEPICMGAEDKERNLQLVILRLIAQESTNAAPFGSSLFELSLWTNLLYTCPLLHYNPMEHPFVTVVDPLFPAVILWRTNWLNWGQLVLSLHNALVTGTHIDANCNVYATILCYVFSLLGVFSWVSIIRAGCAGTLQTKPILTAPNTAGAAAAYEFTYHAVVEVPPQASVPGLPCMFCYDACCRTATNGAVSALPFRTNFASLNVTAAEGATTYRGMVFEVGTPATQVESRTVLAYF